jgi:hypothetical protein
MCELVNPFGRETCKAHLNVQGEWWSKCQEIVSIFTTMSYLVFLLTICNNSLCFG